MAGSVVSTGAASGKDTFKGSSTGSASISVPADAGTPADILLPTTTGLPTQVLQTDGNTPQQLSWASAGAWHRYTITKVADNTNGCGTNSGYGYWIASGFPSTCIPVTVGNTYQTALNLFTLPANGYIHNIRLKTLSACTGSGNVFASLGDTNGGIYFFYSNTYNATTAVGAGNFVDAVPVHVGAGSTNASTPYARLEFTGGATNWNAIVNGCSVAYWIYWSVVQ